MEQSAAPCLKTDANNNIHPGPLQRRLGKTAWNNENIAMVLCKNHECHVEKCSGTVTLTLCRSGIETIINGSCLCAAMPISDILSII